MRKGATIISLIMLYYTGNSQVHGGLEQYYYYSGSGASTIVPRAYYQSSHNWYGEVRYNDEELQTFSFNVGRTFSNKADLSYSVTPLIGFVLGRLNGGTLGSNVNVEYKNLFFSSQFKYAFSIEKRSQDFFFNWTEAGCDLTGRVYAGLALQVTHPYETKNTWEPGIMAGLTFKNWTFPLYAFNPLCAKRNFVLGINWEWKRLPG